MYFLSQIFPDSSSQFPIPPKKMEPSTLVALLSSISQLLLLLLLSPSSSSSATTNTPFSAAHHFLSSQELAATLSLLSLSRKRRNKRARLTSSSDHHPAHHLPRSPDSFKSSFRMSPSTFEWLCSLLEPLLECRDPVGSPLNLSADLRLAIGLFRLSTGANYSQISTHFRVSESVARFCSKQLCRVLCTNYRFWIEFPTKNEFDKVSAGFEPHTGLPNCCGVIECARFLVVRRNGVGEGRVAAQIMVDASCRILSIVAGFRGSKNNETVLKCSTLYSDIERGVLLDSEAVSVDGVAVNQYLVGGEGYPLLPWLMVPYVDAMPGSNEEQFNAAHSRMRLSGLRVVDSLKNWGILSRPICEEMKMAVAYIGACSILHNGLLMREDYSAMSDGLDDDSLYDGSSQCYKGDSSLEESSIESKASVIRNALATKAKEFQESIFSTNSSSSASLQST